MTLSGLIAFGASGLLLLIFVLNLVLARGNAALLGTSAEVLVLFAAMGLFGAGTLIREAQTRG